MIEQTLSRLIDKVENRYHGKYKGFVADNADPENLGRLKLKVPSILGQDVVTGWAMPCLPYGGSSDQGFFFIPEIDAGVWVEFEEGDLEYPIWVGTFWSKPGGASEVPKPADSQLPPTSKIIKTKKGHTIELEDKDGGEKIKLLHSNGALIEFDSNGNIKIEAKGKTVLIEGTNIKLGANATKGLLHFEDFQQLWTQFTTIFMSHMHTGNFGAPTPLIPAAPLPSVTPAFKVEKVSVE